MRGGSNGVKWREVEDAGNRADEEAALCVPSLMPNLAHEGAVMRIGNRTRFIVLTCLIKQLSGCFERGVCQDVTRWGPSVFYLFVSLKQHQQPQHPPPPPPNRKCMFPSQTWTHKKHSLASCPDNSLAPAVGVRPNGLSGIMLRLIGAQ